MGRLIINPLLADIFLLFSAAKGAYSSHDNCNQAFSPVRLVDPLRRRRALARLLRIDVCWSERKRSRCADQTAVGPKEGKESVLRDNLSIRHSDALRAARRDSDHRQPDAHLRARTDATIISGRTISAEWGALPSAAAQSLFFCFRFPTHEAAQPPPHGLDRVLFAFAQQLGVTPPAGFHFANKFACEFS